MNAEGDRSGAIVGRAAQAEMVLVGCRVWCGQYSWAAVAALAQFGNSWLGWNVTNAPTPMTTRRKGIFDLLFVTCGLTSIICVGVIAYRSGRVERAHFSLDLNSKVQCVAGTPLSMKIFFKNVGNGPAVNTDSYSRSFIEEDESRRSAEEAIAKFKVFAKSHDVGTDNIPRDAPGYFMVAQGFVLSREDVENLVNNIRVIYIVGAINFKDDLGPHTQFICKALQRPVSTNGANWDTCGEWDDER